MRIHVTHHAYERWQERIGPASRQQIKNITRSKIRGMGLTLEPTGAYSYRKSGRKVILRLQENGLVVVTILGIVPSEEQEQRTLAQWLNWQKICWLHVPNEGKRSVVGGRRLKQIGLQTGFPDVLILDPPPVDRNCPGVAIELKRSKGGRVQPSQKEWLERLDERGWVTSICHGADEAIELLESLGYGRAS